MGILVSVGRFLVLVAAGLVVVAGIIGGGTVESQASNGFLLGAIVGGIVGLIIAGSLFGALAAVFQIADNTARTALLLEKLEARAPRA